jgi:hypothetical protein
MPWRTRCDPAGNRDAVITPNTGGFASGLVVSADILYSCLFFDQIVMRIILIKRDKVCKKNLSGSSVKKSVELGDQSGIVSGCL